MAFREKGHRAFSCDVIECSGGHPEWHIMQDVIPLLNGDCEFQTQNGMNHIQKGKWDMIIAFPPCTYLCVTGNRWFDVVRYGDKAKQRYVDRYKAIVFFMQLHLRIVKKLLLKILSALCQQHTGNRIRLYSHICLETNLKRKLVCGLKDCHL